VAHRRAPSRRGFIGLAAAWPIAPLPSVAWAQGALRPSALQPHDGELWHVGPTRDPVRIKVSPPGSGRFAMIVQEMAPGSRVPVHLHEREDEIIFIQRGSGRATVGDHTAALGAGSTLHVPQGTWHGGENTGSETLVWVAIYSPSGFEGYFREIGLGPNGETPAMLTPDERAARDRKYGIRYPG
jgi:mannose-6-phosphate isomerase-like protein (cupin superfamily)